jgi:hypothetical protein
MAIQSLANNKNGKERESIKGNVKNVEFPALGRT